MRKTRCAVYVLDECRLIGSLLSDWLERALSDMAVDYFGRNIIGADWHSPTKVDLLIVVCGSPDARLLERIRKLRLENCPLILVVPGGARISIPHLMSQGIAGFISTDISLEQLRLALTTVMLGRKYISPDMVDSFAERKLDNGLEELSRRELSLLTHIARGEDNRAIASSLHISPKTVYTYKHRIYSKLGVNNDVQALLLAFRSGLLDQPSVQRSADN